MINVIDDNLEVQYGPILPFALLHVFLLFCYSPLPLQNLHTIQRIYNLCSKSTACVDSIHSQKF